MSSHQDLLCFGLDQDVYALPLTQVREIVGLPSLTRLPGAPSCLRGIMNLRGSVVPVVDLREQLGLPAPSYGKFTVAIIVEVAGATVGLVVDTVLDVVSLSDSEIDALPAGVSSRVRSDFLIGISMHEDKTLVLIDAERILTDDQKGVLMERPRG